MFDVFEYDEHGCLVTLTPESFDFFMLGPAKPARLVEARWHLQQLTDEFQPPAADPSVENERQSTREMLAASRARLKGPVTQLALMRLSSKCALAISRYRFSREQEDRVGRWLGF